MSVEWVGVADKQEGTDSYAGNCALNEVRTMLSSLQGRKWRQAWKGLVPDTVSSV